MDWKKENLKKEIDDHNYRARVWRIMLFSLAVFWALVIKMLGHYL